MTREEQIQQAATAYEQTITIDHDPVDVELDFTAGATWADANRWVKVEDGLPDTTDLCIVSIDGEEFDLDRFTDSYGDSSGLHACFTRRNVTHWQYITLPEPPKAEQ